MLKKWQSNQWKTRTQLQRKVVLDLFFENSEKKKSYRANGLKMPKYAHNCDQTSTNPIHNLWITGLSHLSVDTINWIFEFFRKIFLFVLNFRSLKRNRLVTDSFLFNKVLPMLMILSLMLCSPKLINWNLIKCFIRDA